MPEPIRGRPLLTIDGACIGSEAEGEAIVAPLRELGETIMDTWGQIPAEGLCRIHMDPENPVPGLGEGHDDPRASRRGDRRLRRVAGPGSGSPMLLSELRQLGGALGRPDPDGGALTHLETDFVMYSVGMPMTPELGEAIPQHLKKIEETMQPWAGEGSYYNFTERPCDADAILPAEVCARLAEVKRR